MTDEIRDFWSRVYGVELDYVEVDEESIVLYVKPPVEHITVTSRFLIPGDNDDVKTS